MNNPGRKGVPSFSNQAPPAYRIEGSELVRVDGKRSQATRRRVSQLKAEGRILNA